MTGSLTTVTYAFFFLSTLEKFAEGWRCAKKGIIGCDLSLLVIDMKST